LGSGFEEYNTDVIKILLKNGADPNIKTLGGESSLQFALREKNQECIALLQGGEPALKQIKQKGG